jgi:S-adenosylmethionine decarboxylase
MRGLHVMGDLYECGVSAALLRDAAALTVHIKTLCAKAALQVVGASAHTFPGGGCTVAVLLAESHVTVHTWPEHASVALDVYVCNHSRDNRAQAWALAHGLVAVLGCRVPQLRAIERGEVTAPRAAHALQP